MKIERFEFRKWFVIDATPAQFGGLVEGLNSLYATGESARVVIGLQQPFHVYWPLSSSGQVVIVRYPGSGEIDVGNRDPRYGWIDAIPRLDGKTDLVMIYNFSTTVLPLDTRLLLWKMLFGWLEESGCPAFAEKEAEDLAPDKPKHRGKSMDTDANALKAYQLQKDNPTLKQRDLAERFAVSSKTIGRWMERAKGLLQETD